MNINNAVISEDDLKKLRNGKTFNYEFMTELEKLLKAEKITESYEEEFNELVSMICAIYTSAKLLGYSNSVMKEEGSLVRLNIKTDIGGGYLSIALKQTLPRPKLTIYARFICEFQNPTMNSYKSHHHTEKISILQEILENL